jgi:hypothetical protein
MEEFNHKHFNYKWTKGFGIAIFIALVLLVGSAYAQVVSGSVNTPSGYSIDSISGNLIPYDSSLKTNNGWTSTTGAAGNWSPYGSPQGSFDPSNGYTFSYLGEEMGVAGINLSNIVHGYQNTSAVFVTGFIYGIKYRFPCANQIGGSCTDTNGPQDTLRVEVGYYPSSGAATFYTHQLGLKNQTDGNSAYNPNWQTLAETVTFAGAKPLVQAGSVNMGIYGQDAGFWACLPNAGAPDSCYGPQVKDAYVRATYSVDPCILNPAFNPSCPGFNNILQYGQSPLIWFGYNIAQKLPHIGGGVQLHGFDYGFGYYAGDYCTAQFIVCWSSSGANGRNVTLNITDKNGSSLFSDTWWVEGNYSGGSRSGRVVFTETQNSLNMGYVSWSMYGGYGDNMGFSAYTRPIWTPDPCYEQPLYSKNCSNYNDEIKRLAALEQERQEAALASTVASVTSTATTPEGSITTTINDANTTNPGITVNTNPPPPDRPPPEDSTSSRPPPPQTTSVAGAPVPREEQRQETPRQESRDAAPRATVRVESTSDSTSMALNLIRQNQQRETAIASTASQNAMQTASIAATASIRQAEAVAMDAVNRSQQTAQPQQQVTGTESILSNNREQTLNMGPTPGSTSVVNMTIQQRSTQGQTIVDMPQQQSTASTSTSAIVQFNAMATTTVQPVQMFNPLQPPVFSAVTQPTATPYTPPVQAQTFETRSSDSNQIMEQAVNTNNNQIAILQPQQVVASIPQTIIQTAIVAPVVTVDIPQPQMNFISDKTNPINDIIEAKPVMPEADRNNTNTQQVKSNVQDNDAAAGVSIASIARTPVGFNTYMVALTDANFYAPKEIYRNQRTVDNARALRQLASDRLHQQMVDQQYLPR